MRSRRSRPCGDPRAPRLGRVSTDRETPHPHGRKCCTSAGKADYTRLEAHLRRYTARNTFDFFIHEDLGRFLDRELDFYLKSDIMHLDDVENEAASRVEQYLITANDGQREEWVRLFAIDAIKGDLTTPRYRTPLAEAFLKAHPTLVVAMRHFHAALKQRLLEAIGDVDEITDGLLIHSENFQVL